MGLTLPYNQHLSFKRSSVPQPFLEISIIQMSPALFFKSSHELGVGCMGSVDLVFTKYEHLCEEEPLQSDSQPVSLAESAIDFESEAVVIDKPKQVIKIIEYDKRRYKTYDLFKQMVVREFCFMNQAYPTPAAHRIFEYQVGKSKQMAIQMDVFPGEIVRSIVAKNPSYFHSHTDFFLEFMSQVIKQLAVIGDNHIVHRDIKPDNLFWDSKSRQMTLFDFGFGQWENDCFWGLSDSNTMQAPLYTAPELLGHGFVDNVTCAADIFQAGLVLFNSIDRTQNTRENRYGSPLFSIQENLDSHAVNVFHFFVALRNNEQRDHQGIIDDRLMRLEKDTLPSTGLFPRQQGLVMQALRGMIVIDPFKRMSAEVLLEIAVALPYTSEERLTLLEEALRES